MGMQRWCPCGFVAVWRRGELSQRSVSSAFLLPSDRDGPGCLTPNLWTLLKSFRVWKQGTSEKGRTESLVVTCFMWEFAYLMWLLRDVEESVFCAQSKQILPRVFFQKYPKMLWTQQPDEANDLLAGSETINDFLWRLQKADVVELCWRRPSVNVKVFFCERLPIICVWVTSVIYYLSKLKLAL